MKSMLTRIIAVGALLAVAALAQAGSQPAFTFKFPVSVKNLHPDVDQIRIIAQLYTTPHGKRSNAKSVGVKHINVGSSRSVEGTYTLNMNRKNPGQYKSYSAGLEFHNKKTKEWRKPSRSAKKAWYRSGDGTGVNNYYYSIPN